MIDRGQVQEREKELQKAAAAVKGNGHAKVGALYAAQDQAAAPAPVRVDLGCGQTKPEGWLGVDAFAAAGVDVVHDLFTFPWPFEDSSVDEVRCSHFFEHVPGRLRPLFMAELWRILKPGASALITTPYGWSSRSVQDFTHEWPPVVSESYLYFSEPWRDANKLTHGAYDIACNFDIDFPAQALSPTWAARHHEALQYAATHYLNVVMDITARLVKVPRVEHKPEEGA